jgi:hypothetical protein
MLAEIGRSFFSINMAAVASSSPHSDLFPIPAAFVFAKGTSTWNSICGRPQLHWRRCGGPIAEQPDYPWNSMDFEPKQRGRKIGVLKDWAQNIRAGLTAAHFFTAFEEEFASWLTATIKIFIPHR